MLAARATGFDTAVIEDACRCIMDEHDRRRRAPI
jgi:hypothetical protein